jgi:hypothetical protein
VATSFFLSAWTSCFGIWISKGVPKRRRMRNNFQRRREKPLELRAEVDSGSQGMAVAPSVFLDEADRPAFTS